MLVRWLGSFPASALLAQVGGSVNTRSSPTSERLAQVGGSVNTRSSPVTENAPLGNVREPTGGVLSKVDQVGLSRWSCCHWILGKAFTLLSLDKVRVRAVGPSWIQTLRTNVPGHRGELKQQAKTKARGPNRGE